MAMPAAEQKQGAAAAAAAADRHKLFAVQAAEYAASRPECPLQLIQRILRHVPEQQRRLAWDVGTGSGQAAAALAPHFEAVVGTDVSAPQLSHAFARPNIRYVATPERMTPAEAEALLGVGAAHVDVVTVSQALHWFHLESFYACVRHMLRPETGVIAAWCYTEPRFGEAALDEAFDELYAASAADGWWDSARYIVDGQYRCLPFPFRRIEEEEEEKQLYAEKQMDLKGFFTYIRSWSAYQTALQRGGVDLLDSQRLLRFQRAWGDPLLVRTARFPAFILIGRV